MTSASRSAQDGDDHRVASRRPASARAASGAGLARRRCAAARPAEPAGCCVIVRLLVDVAGHSARGGCRASRSWPAISRPISSRVGVRRGRSPMILPRYMTAIRSARPSTSSSSVETSTTAVPLSRSRDDPACG